MKDPKVVGSNTRSAINKGCRAHTDRRTDGMDFISLVSTRLSGFAFENSTGWLESQGQASSDNLSAVRE